jgi:hypothetical protein
MVMRYGVLSPAQSILYTVAETLALFLGPGMVFRSPLSLNVWSDSWKTSEPRY